MDLHAYYGWRNGRFEFRAPKSVYLGSQKVGWIEPANGWWLARSRSGDPIGEYSTRNRALNAIDLEMLRHMYGASDD
jgi:hypothetical protein